MEGKPQSYTVFTRDGNSSHHMVPEFLKIAVSYMTFIPNAVAQLSPIRTIVFGLLIIGFLLFEPQGLAEIWRRVRRFFHLWPFKK